MIRKQSFYGLRLRNIASTCCRWNIYHIPRVRGRVGVPAVALRAHLRFTSILVQLLWFGHAARCPDGELIRDPLLPKPPRTWLRPTGGQMKMCAFMTKADLEHLAGPRVFGELSPVRSHKTDEPGAPAQPTLVECRHIYK